MIRAAIVREDRQEAYDPSKAQMAMPALSFPTGPDVDALAAEPMTEAERQWVEDNYRLVRRAAWRSPGVRRAARNSADAVGYVLPHAVKALRRHDPARGKVSTLMFCCVRRLAKPEAVRPRSRWWSGHSPHGDVPLLLSGADVAERDQEPPPDLTELYERVAAAFAGLRPRQREVLGRFLGLDRPGETAAAIAADWGVSRERVMQMVRRDLQDLADAAGFEVTVRRGTFSQVNPGRRGKYPRDKATA